MKRRRFDAEFKAKVALEAVQGDLTIAELSNKYSVGPTQVKEWKSDDIGSKERRLPAEVSEHSETRRLG